MERTLLLLGIAIGSHSFVFANPGLSFDPIQSRIKPRLVIALNDNTSNVGTDAGTSSYPNAGGMDTVNTQDVGTGTETNTKDNPPYGQAPAYSPAPPYTPARPYTPPKPNR